MSGAGDGDGKLPSVDHGRRTDRGRDKKMAITNNSEVQRKLLGKLRNLSQKTGAQKASLTIRLAIPVYIKS
jgi:hypothetical protein